MRHPRLGASPRIRRALPVLGALVLATGAAACGSSGSATPSSSSTSRPTTTTTLPPTTTTTVAGARPAIPSSVQVSLFFMRGAGLGVAHRIIPFSSDFRSVTVKALLGGPVASETAAGLSTQIPSGSVLRGLAVTNGVATANFSPGYITGGTNQSIDARVSQVVYTLTQFPNVKTVRFEVGGSRLATVGGINLTQPIGRSQLTSALPNVLLQTPAVGDTLHSPVTMSGLSNFIGTYYVQVVDATGKLVLNNFGTSTVGSSFSDTFPYSTTATGSGKVRLFTLAAAKGSVLEEVDVPVQVAP